MSEKDSSTPCCIRHIEIALSGVDGGVWLDVVIIDDKCELTLKDGIPAIEGDTHGLEVEGLPLDGLYMLRDFLNYALPPK